MIPQPSTLLLSLLDAALLVVDPRRAVARTLTGPVLNAIVPANRLLVVAIGKAAPAMAMGAIDSLPGAIDRGVIVTHALAGSHPPGFELLIGDHPVPGQASLAAGRASLELASEAVAGDFVLFLISGGGSALAEVPAPGVELSDIVGIIDSLDRAGATIHDINPVRSRLSMIKGGGLAAAAQPARFGTLVVSDVPGDDATVVASGPSLGAAGGVDAWEVVTRYGIRVSAGVAAALHAGAAPVPVGDFAEVVASGPMAALAAAEAAAAYGLGVTVDQHPLAGEASVVARALVAETREPGVYLYSGETTVTRKGAGRGGRNQEGALAAAIALDGSSGTVFLAAATDGRDGPTENSGGLVDGTTAQRIRDAGIDPAAALDDNDSATALEAAGAHLRSGATGTNVGDLWMVMRQ